jgi:alpha-glucosidase
VALGACRSSTVGKPAGGSAGAPPAVGDAAVAGASFAKGALQLRIEALREDLVHFELAPVGSAGSIIATSPMVVAPTAPLAWTKREGSTLETRELRVEVDAASLCVRVTDLARGVLLHRLCPTGESASAVTITRETTQNVYGLGEQFSRPGETDGDWLGRERMPGNEQGNAMVKFDGSKIDSGSVGNAQFPILYAAGPGTQAYAMFVDDTYPERWSFTGDPWTLRTTNPALRWYVMAGPDLADLRRDYMTLVGRAPVPPKQAFGLWVSEYGYDDWKELDAKLASLRSHKFPVDGFVLDLQWFGGITEKSDTSRMGGLAWDRAKFPDPDKKVRALADDGIGLVLIEESYVSRGLPEHAELAKRDCLARDCPTCPPTYLTSNPWWGQGGMIDWTRASCADYWHDAKRQPLVDIGVLGHWCDLGEPEMYSPTSVYAGGKHVDIHNMFTFTWLESIARGYERHHVTRRPFMMARSGAPGLQRFGASMWSGDISSNLTTLAAHLNAQLHMSFSGIDYFGADIGGFIREALRGNLDEMYTQWFADGMAIDVPGRVHTANQRNDRETAPDRIGHMASNLANVRRRYELVPYVYSLAHHAATTGDPVFPPLVWAFPEDVAARSIGGEKLIGSDLLVAMVAKDGARSLDVYLPRGATWVDFAGTRRYPGGQTLKAVALRDASGVLRLPMYMRAGAIVPLAFVDDRTMNVLGKRSDGTRHDELRAQIVPTLDAASTTTFTLVEDDGVTTGYQHGELRATELTQTSDPTAKRVTVAIAPAKGTYPGAPQVRAAVVDVVLDAAAKPRAVTVDGAAVAKQATVAACESAASGWCMTGPGRLRVKAPEAAVGTGRSIVVEW